MTEVREPGDVTVLVGGQYGSEGKGVIADHLARNYEYTAAVRVGGPNAGHSFIFGGEKLKVQQLPVAMYREAQYAVFGAGAVVDPYVLDEEIKLCEAKTGRVLAGEVLIDSNAVILTPEMRRAEGGVNGAMHSAIGSTGEGVGIARAAKMMRVKAEGQKTLARDWPDLPGIVVDTEFFLNKLIDDGEPIFIEGTQGFGLSLHHGFWPYVTSSDTSAAQLLADTGVATSVVTELGMVCRTFPIRVAGNSGPLYRELTWGDMAIRTGNDALVPEKTTVTKKIRRIGEWDWGLFEKAVRVNRPTWIALTFIDYINRDDTGKTKIRALSDVSRKFIDAVEDRGGVHVRFVGTGGDNWAVATWD